MLNRGLRTWKFLPFLVPLFGDFKLSSFGMGNTSGPSQDGSPAKAMLSHFNLGFNNEGILKQFNPKSKELTDQGFVFDVHNGDREKNQKRYEQIGQIMDQVIYEKLEQAGLQRVWFPENGDVQSFFFASENYQEADKLLVLIHGSGVVRAGQWTRKLILNNGLTEGSVLPFLEKAKELDMAVIVTNTNYKHRDKKPIPESNTPSNHGKYIWKNFILPSKVREIFIVAHSYGGVVTMELAKTFPDDFMKRVVHLSLTDSVHNQGDLDPRLLKHLQKVGINYVTSEHPLDHPLSDGDDDDDDDQDIPVVSAGHTEHEWTTFSSLKSIFKRLEEGLNKASQKPEELQPSDPPKKLKADEEL